jgi:hypothetical protein
METALDILEKQDCNGYCQGAVFGDFYYEKEEILAAMIEFAKMHVKAALQEASEKALLHDKVNPNDISIKQFKGFIPDKDSILNAYSLDNIK